ncbi:ATP-dependent RNA helicase DBP4 [Cyphellophora attinorum]|uniref:ATP-dependent RNA helicase n=1 Tax=Cyphellophora attinorum TaxID=1664694 RepID=A0A0N0NKN8_9EURO|nr:ATP-dependent RNA helicase DBP4 [Phialophora attinorum]KPI38248.1 ATP-dependent RNA helicase DBP4 [Phialophora attinorum]
MKGSRSQKHGRQRRQSTQRPKVLKRKRDEEDLQSLSRRVDELEAHPATPPTLFSELPLSAATQDGLSKAHFKALTTIQARAIPAALKGGDILGAAKTGSGKTLAFLIPVLENLYRKRWTEFDGLGALILSPTRELAIQIFDVLRKVGCNHSFSAGLVIGGKSLQEEQERLGRMNILVATPGRMQQHLDQTAELDVGNLQMLVLDEADRIMDMGFSHTLDAIIEHLPQQDRQTLLFSATQTKRVSDLARLSLTEPLFVSVHDTADSATPSQLQQNYIVTPLANKLDTLWSFLRANVKKKILVFLSSGKQVRFVYEAFRHLQPGLTILHLHGRQKQTARVDITKRFSNSRYACLFSTDVAARGLDFPSVDWVVQVDCPEDTDTYIHRVGRTARFEHEGRAVMFLDPSEEEGMIGALEKKKVVLEKINVRPSKMQNTIKHQLQNMCFKDPELKYLGQKAFVSYVRSVIVQKDKEVFDVKKLDLEAYAASLGLPGAPRVKFIKGEDANKRKNMPRQLLKLQEEIDGGDSDEDEGLNDGTAKKEVRTKYDRMFERQNQDVLANHYTKLIQDDEDNNGIHGNPSMRSNTEIESEDDAFLSVKRRFAAGDSALNQNDEDDEEEDGDEARPKTITLGPHPTDSLTIDSNRRSKLLKSKKALLKYKGAGEHLHFSSDEDTPYKKEYYEDEAKYAAQGKEEAEAERRRFVEAERERVRLLDVRDKEVAKAKKREKREKRKGRERGQQGEDDGDDERGDRGDDDDGVQLVNDGEVEIVPDWSDGDFEDYAVGNSGGPAVDKEEGGKPKEKKRKKKWFEDPSSGDDDDDNDTQKKNKSKKRKHAATAMQEPQTLEDLEAMASGLLAR